MGSLVPQTESMIEQCFTSGLINTGVCSNWMSTRIDVHFNIC